MSDNLHSFRPKTLGQAIRLARTQRAVIDPETGKKRRMTQQDLADVIEEGMSHQTVGYWENDKWKPSPNNLTALRKFFGSDLQEPVEALDTVSLAEWRGRVIQIAKQMALVLAEQEELAADMAGTPPAAEIVYADDDARNATQSVADDAAAVGQPDAQKPARRKKSG